MTETDRTVQVPVSLLRELHDTLGFHVGYEHDLTQHVGALLSQPTPTAEPVLPVRAVAAVMDTYDNGEGECEPEDRWRLFRDMRALLAPEQVTQPTPTAEPEAAGHAYEQGNFGDDGLCHARIQPGHPSVGRCYRPRSEHAELPQIEDMAAGTTFTEEVRWTVTGELSTSQVVAHSNRGDMKFADRFDPSTIRGVTPPAGV